MGNLMTPVVRAAHFTIGKPSSRSRCRDILVARLPTTRLEVFQGESWKGGNGRSRKILRRSKKLPSLKLTRHLKIDPWKRRFLLETTIFRGYVCFREWSETLNKEYTHVTMSTNGKIFPPKIGIKMKKKTWVKVKTLFRALLMDFPSLHLSCLFSQRFVLWNHLFAKQRCTGSNCNRPWATWRDGKKEADNGSTLPPITMEVENGPQTETSQWSSRPPFSTSMIMGERVSLYSKHVEMSQSKAHKLKKIVQKSLRT